MHGDWYGDDSTNWAAGDHQMAQSTSQSMGLDKYLCNENQSRHKIDSF